MSLKFVERDDSLTHQIKLLFDKENGNAVRITCNCLGVEHQNGSVSYDFMPGFPKDTQQARDIYYEPSNHRKPFEAVDQTKRVSPSRTATG